MSLCLLAYPSLIPSDYERIQSFRALHDRYFRVVEPHFSFVFPMPVSMNADTFIEEIEKQSRGEKPFSFCLRCAVLNQDASKELFHAFLVPDEGYNHIVRLHDRLYANQLFPYRRLDVDYIPHVGVGNAADPRMCLEMIGHWNREEFAIAGQISVLDVGNFENNTVETLHRIPLGG